jgi:hypothetical protein
MTVSEPPELDREGALRLRSYSMVLDSIRDSLPVEKSMLTPESSDISRRRRLLRSDDPMGVARLAADGVRDMALTAVWNDSEETWDASSEEARRRPVRPCWSRSSIAPSCICCGLCFEGGLRGRVRWPERTVMFLGADPPWLDRLIDPTLELIMELPSVEARLAASTESLDADRVSPKEPREWLDPDDSMLFLGLHCRHLPFSHSPAALRGARLDQRGLSRFFWMS